MKNLSISEETRKKMSRSAYDRCGGVVKRFFAKIEKTNYCWEWLANKDRDGYGNVTIRKVMYKAHRVSYCLANAIQIETFKPDVCVLHKCDNPSCVNPEHLFLGSQLDNIKDKMSKNRCARNYGESHPLSKLTNSDVFKIRKYSKEGKLQIEIADMFNVTDRTISSIILRKTWNHI